MGAKVGIQVTQCYVDFEGQLRLCFTTPQVFASLVIDQTDLAKIRAAIQEYDARVGRNQFVKTPAKPEADISNAETIETWTVNL